MAKYQTKYSMYLASATAAALVATVVAPIVPAASEAPTSVEDKKSVMKVSKFTDTKGHKYEEAINALVDAKIISGYPDGLFRPDKKLTRSDVVKVLGKWLIAEGYDIPADAVSNPRFADLNATSPKELLEYAAITKDNGVFKGNDGRLLALNDITAQQTALVLVRALDNVKDVDLAAYVADQKDFKKDDRNISSGRIEVRAAIDVLDYFGITNQEGANFDPNGFTTRGQFTALLFESINTDFSEVTGVPSVNTIKSVNNTTIEVEFEKAVENIDLLTFTIDGLTITNVEIKEDGKTIVLTTTEQESGEEYTVMLNGRKQSSVVSNPDNSGSDDSDSDGSSGGTPPPTNPGGGSGGGSGGGTPPPPNPGGGSGDGAPPPVTPPPTNPGGGSGDGTAPPVTPPPTNPGGGSGDGTAPPVTPPPTNPGGGSGDDTAPPVTPPPPNPGGGSDDGTAPPVTPPPPNPGGGSGDGTAPPVTPPPTNPGGGSGDGTAPPVTPPPTNPGGSLTSEETMKAVNAAKSEAEVLDILKRSSFQPSFSALNPEQQQAVANVVFTGKPGFGTNFGGYTEYYLNNIYQAGYVTQQNKAVEGVDQAKDEATLEAALRNVPGLNLDAYHALAAAEKRAVNRVLLANNYSSIENLQKAIDAEIVAPILTPILAAINSASDSNTLKDLLETNKDILKLDTFTYDKLPVAERVRVADTLLAKRPAGGYTVESLRTEFVEASKISTGDETQIFTARSIELVNERRAQDGIVALNHDPELSRIAQIKAEDMAQNQYFAHDSPTYGSPGAMMNHFGYVTLANAENIAAGQTSAEEAVAGWIKSAGHFRNLMGTTTNQIGAGYAVDKTGRTYWVHMFALK